ncbi:MAG: spore coat associated protein CotJA [Velocimicrobium sp.]
MDYMKPFGCNCQNKVSIDNNRRCHDHNIENTTHNACEVPDPLHALPLAMAYVPWQTWKNVYDASNGLKKGTIFGELIFPFLFASPVCRDCNYNNGRRCDMR